MIKTIQFEFGEIRIFRSFVVVVMKEGITVKPEYNNDLWAIAEEYFFEKPFGYITYRINSYSVDPLVYIETSKITNLVGFAVVSSEGIKLSNLELEKRFLKKPFRHFGNLDEAKDWINTLVNEKASDN